jgi:hypothetical protein
VGFSFLGAEGMIGICDLRGFFFPISFDIENLANQSFPKKNRKFSQIYNKK